jgi:REP element-mobilizing transposase RayT
MSRLARVVIPGMSHHVTQRGVRRLDVFRDDEDRLLYLRLFAQSALLRSRSGLAAPSNLVNVSELKKR